MRFIRRLTPDTFGHLSDRSAMKTFLDGRVQVLVGDLTLQDVDAVVNAANSTLLGGGGVDGAIHSRGGPRILDACMEIRRHQWPDGLPPGEAVLTPGGNLLARYVIHTVGPIYGRSGGRDTELLASCYRRSLELAAENGLQSVAFPAISTGVYGYPKPQAAVDASTAIAQALPRLPGVREVRLVFFAEPDAAIFLEHQRFEPTGRASGP